MFQYTVGVRIRELVHLRMWLYALMCVYTRSAAAGGRTYASALCVYVLLSSLYKYGDYKSAKKELSLSISARFIFGGV